MNTLVDLLEQAAGRYGDQAALSIAAGLSADVWSYRRLWRAANAIAASLREDQGLVRGDRVLVWAPNSPHLVAAYFGCMLAGVVLVPLDPHSTPDFVARVAAKTQARAVISSFASADAAAAVPDLRVLRQEALPLDGPEPGPRPLERPRADDVVEVVFTSGTTGNPKGVVLTHRNVMANVAAAGGLIPRRTGYRLLSVLPLSHMLEQTAGLYLPLACGATIHYLPGRQPSLIARTLRRRRITTMVVVPLVLEVLLRGVEQEVRRRGRWRLWQRLQALAARLPLAARRLLFRGVHRHLGGALECLICGGAYLPPPLARAWERLGVRVVEGYGATECAPIVAANTWGERVPGSVGRPLPGVQVRLSAEGEVLVTGPNVTAGYWRDAAAARAAFTDDGWYRTGDLGEIDSSGRLYLRGRLKDLIVLPTGLNVHPEDVERELRREEGIAECVVLGLADPARTLRVHAAVLPSNSAGASAARGTVEAAVRRANARLAPHQRVAGFTLWEGGDFPRTSTLKVKRHEVRAILAGQSPWPASAAAAAVAGPQAMAAGDRLSRLRRILAEVSGVPVERITPSSDLGLDLHLDSLARVELAVRLEEELGCAIDEGQLAAAHTVAGLLELVEGAAHGAGATAPPAPEWALRGPAVWLRSALQRGLVFPLHALVCRPFDVEGRERLRSLPLPALFIANHASHLDTPSILRALPPAVRRRVAVAAAADYFYRDRALGTAASLALNTFPFSRDGAVRASLEYCGELVDAGWSILIYPEGTRSPAGALQPFKSGIGLLARELRVPIVPVAIDGTHRVLPKGATRPRPGPVRVRFGKPVAIAPGADCADVTALLQASLACLAAGPRWRGGLLSKPGSGPAWYTRADPA